MGPPKIRRPHALLNNALVCYIVRLDSSKVDNREGGRYFAINSATTTIHKICLQNVRYLYRVLELRLNGEDRLSSSSLYGDQIRC